MITTCFEKLPGLIPHCLLGSGLILAAVALGWWEGRRCERWPARMVSWWLRHVVRPLLAGCSWIRRTITIVANNALICFVMVTLGAVQPVAWLAVAAVGLGLGIALRLMLLSPPEPAAEIERPTRWRRVTAAVGVGLNLLEVPAIALSAGLCLAQKALSPAIEGEEARRVFGTIVLPMLVIAAAGEALWMGVYPARSHGGVAEFFCDGIGEDHGPD